MMISRRGALLLGVGGLGVFDAGSAALLDENLQLAARARRVLGMTGPNGSVPPELPASAPAIVTTHRMHSAARGTDVKLITIVPANTPTERLPVCLLLHGRRSDAASWVSMGLGSFLDAAIRAGAAPFALAAVDGGDSYWVARTPGDDPQAMLRTELPGWLTRFGLPAGGGVPRAALGVSMGCFGALVYAHTVDRPARRPLRCSVPRCFGPGPTPVRCTPSPTRPRGRPSNRCATRHRCPPRRVVRPGGSVLPLGPTTHRPTAPGAGRTCPRRPHARLLAPSTTRGTALHRRHRSRLVSCHQDTRRLMSA